jgi:hypothetical protein
LGKLLVLPTNVRLDRKVIARYKHSSLFRHIISNEGNKFYNIDTWRQFHKTVLSVSYTFLQKDRAFVPGKLC